MSEHELKTEHPFFEDVWSGAKTCELRKDDRGFRVGDILQLREYDVQRRTFGPRTIVAQVTHVLRLWQPGWFKKKSGIAIDFDTVLSFAVLAREGG